MKKLYDSSDKSNLTLGPGLLKSPKSSTLTNNDLLFQLFEPLVPLTLFCDHQNQVRKTIGLTQDFLLLIDKYCYQNVIDCYCCSKSFDFHYENCNAQQVCSVYSLNPLNELPSLPSIAPTLIMLSNESLCIFQFLFFPALCNTNDCSWPSKPSLN